MNSQLESTNSKGNFVIKQGQKRPLDTPKRMIKKKREGRKER